jgi:two-component system nitrate/nitrite sensor histidine kinase NarX
MPSLLARIARFNHRLSTRIVALSGVALTLVLAMIIGTLWLSWQLEGAGAAINDAGSLRMRAANIAVALDEARAGRPNEVRAEVALLERTLDNLRRGEPARPLFLPDSPEIQDQFGRVESDWRRLLKPVVSDGRATPAPERLVYVERLPSFIEEANTLVRMIEQENARKTAWLRRSQMALAAMACIGTIAIVYLLYLWFVVPVQRLEHGLARIEQRDFDARLPVETQDEFGRLAQGFNRMAYQLQGHHREFERRVDMKTAQLAAQNRELTALYEMTAFLHESHDVEALCRGFLERVMRRFDAQGGTVRTLGHDDGNLHLIASEGMPRELVDAERCMATSDCLCGVATQRRSAVVHYAREHPPLHGKPPDNCQKAGFADVAAFNIVSQTTSLGSFSLHFAQDHTMPASQVQVLEALGRHLGTALQNHRLASAARQFAVAQERHLVAQGLHDSIAQSLNFLKIQVHMLDTAANESRLDEVREIVPLLRGGLEECYDDVRELLVNFRTKLESGDLKRVVADTVARFERQSNARVDCRFDETGGPTLPPDQQLQVLFILQEALSNVRKHAEASRVRVAIENGREFRMLIEDDGQGFAPAPIDESGDAHVGFRIMRERAVRLDAQLRIESAPGAGTRVSLTMPESVRPAA